MFDYQIQRYKKYLKYASFLMIISLYKVLKINKLHIRRKHKLDTSYFTPY